MIWKFLQKNKMSWREITLLSFLFLVIFADSRKVFPSLGKEMIYIATRLIRYPHFSYEEKMKEKVGEEYYDWTKLVREHTTISSYVMHPPQMWPWGQSGNPEFSQYFLYPAKLIREDRKRLFDPHESITHVMIAWGEGNAEESAFGWPKFPLFAKQIYYLPQRRKIAVMGLENLQEWQRWAKRTVNYYDGKNFDLTYTSSSFDYWIKPVNFKLSPETKLSVKVKSNWPNSVALIAKISFGNKNFGVFSSAPNRKVDEWEVLTISDLYPRAIEFGRIQGWGISGLQIEAIGIDTGRPAKMPFLEKWGIIELEKGGEERVKFLRSQSVNSQTLLPLGNIYNLEGKDDEAYSYYYKAMLLEPSDPLIHLELAELADKKGNKILAKREYAKAVELAPELPWFHYAQGEFYRREGDREKAIANYQKSIETDPLSFWAQLALGEIYEEQDRLDLAYRHYSLASLNWAFTSDGKIAIKKKRKIEEEQKKIIGEVQEKIKETPNDINARLTLGKTYFILGEFKKAKEQYELARKLRGGRVEEEESFPPIFTDDLNQPIYTIRGQRGKVVFVEGRAAAIFDNYQEYNEYSHSLLTKDSGTIEISWRPPDDFGENQIPRNLLYQFRGLFVWVDKLKVNFAIFDENEQNWVIVASEPVKWDESKWYRIAVSYGLDGMSLFLEGERIGYGPFRGGINKLNNVFLSRGPLWVITKKPVSSGYFEKISVFDYQKTKWD